MSYDDYTNSDVLRELSKESGILPPLPPQVAMPAALLKQRATQAVAPVVNKAKFQVNRAAEWGMSNPAVRHFTQNPDDLAQLGQLLKLGASEKAPTAQQVARARNALARVAQHGSPAEQEAVQAAVHAKYPSINKEAAAQHTLVTGHSGAGKSTLARSFGLPIHALDDDPDIQAQIQRQKEYASRNGGRLPSLDNPEYNKAMQRAERRAIGRALALADPHVVEGAYLLNRRPAGLRAHKLHLVDVPQDVVLAQRVERERQKDLAKGLTWSDERAAGVRMRGQQLIDEYEPGVQRWRAAPYVTKHRRDAMNPSEKRAEVEYRGHTFPGRYRNIALGAGAGLAGGVGAVLLRRPGLRAHINAKANALFSSGASARLAKENIGGSIPEAARKSARDLIRSLTSQGYSKKQIAQMKIGVTGTSGSGKSSVARALEEELGMSRISLDPYISKVRGGRLMEDAVDKQLQGLRPGTIVEQTQLLHATDPSKFDLLVRIERPVADIRKGLLGRGHAAFTADYVDFNKAQKTVNTAFATAGGKEINISPSLSARLKPGGSAENRVALAQQMGLPVEKFKSLSQRDQIQSLAEGKVVSKSWGSHVSKGGLGGDLALTGALTAGGGLGGYALSRKGEKG